MDLTEILELASKSDVGLTRSHNEDSSAVDASLGLLVIADGMGGYSAGEIASALSVSTILKYVRQQLPNLQAQQVDLETGFTMESMLLCDAIKQANFEIFRSARENPQFKGMGTTILVVLFYDNKYTVAHVGDSRLYLYRDNILEKTTNDHSLIQELVNRGLYTLEEAKARTPSNLVTRALGISEEVNVDIFESAVLPNDLFLLCTDGLTDMVSDSEITATIEAHGDEIEHASQALIDLANARGGKDNISVILARPTAPFSISNGWIDKIFSRN